MLCRAVTLLASVVYAPPLDALFGAVDPNLIALLHLWVAYKRYVTPYSAHVVVTKLSHDRELGRAQAVAAALGSEILAPACSPDP